MKTIIKICFLCFLTFCFNSYHSQYLISANYVNSISNVLLANFTSLTLDYEVDMYKMVYNTVDAQGQPTIASGAFLVPKNANCNEFINKLPLKLNSFVGEKGIKLSGGQKQRIAIARAIASKCPILILDEATSALDSKSEKLVQDALDRIMKEKTSIVIAHRLSTIKNADKILVLDDGEIVESGSHSELLNLNGIYSNLIKLQSIS